MLGEGKKSGIISRSLLYEEFSQKSLSGLNWDIFGSLSALIIVMVHIPYKGRRVFSSFHLVWFSRSKVLLHRRRYQANLFTVFVSLFTVFVSLI